MFAEQKYGVKIVDQYRIHELYPFSHVVVSFPCSTNIFSNIFKRNLIIYDYQGLTKSNYARNKEFRIPKSRIVYTTNKLEIELNKIIKLPMSKYSSKEKVLVKELINF